MIERVRGDRRAPQALILLPTRELAMQVAEEVAKLALFKRGVRELPIYGGASYDRQLRGLREGAHRSSSARRAASWTIWSAARSRSRR